MGKISELELAISDLRSAASTINDVANTLAEMFSSKDTAEPTAAEAPVEEKQPLTKDE